MIINIQRLRKYYLCEDPPLYLVQIDSMDFFNVLESYCLIIFIFVSNDILCSFYSFSVNLSCFVETTIHKDLDRKEEIRLRSDRKREHGKRRILHYV